MSSILDKSATPRDVANDGSRFWVADLGTADEGPLPAGHDGWVGIVDEEQGGVFAIAHETHARHIITALRAYTGEE